MKKVIEKINDDILERSIKHNFKELEKMGYSSHEFEYRTCRCSKEDLKDYYFVVSKKLEYRNGSLIGYNYKVYAYDNKGNYVTDDSVYEKCVGSFFKNLVDI
jgi:UDP-N-acetylenolpyruvoylglucosamine reductase